MTPTVTAPARRHREQDKARRAGQELLAQVGIADRIEVIGGFAPRGRALRQFIGMDAGSVAGAVLGGPVGDAIGSIGGAEMSADYGERRTGLPPRVFLAVGRSGVYALGAGKHANIPLNFLAGLPADTRIRVRRRVTVRVVELRDRHGQKVLEVEGAYGPFLACRKTIAAIRALTAGPTARTQQTA